MSGGGQKGARIRAPKCLDVASPSELTGREWKTRSMGRMSPEDFVPCSRCGLRGHVAGDPDRCFQKISLRLGEQSW